jgi:hypothetical protein
VRAREVDIARLQALLKLGEELTSLEDTGALVKNPCKVRRVLPPNEDKNPEWRDLASYSHAELEMLISSRLLPQDRRTVYALKGVGGMRTARSPC